MKQVCIESVNLIHSIYFYEIIQSSRVLYVIYDMYIYIAYILLYSFLFYQTFLITIFHTLHHSQIPPIFQLPKQYPSSVYKKIFQHQNVNVNALFLNNSIHQISKVNNTSLYNISSRQVQSSSIFKPYESNSTVIPKNTLPTCPPPSSSSSYTPSKPTPIVSCAMSLTNNLLNYPLSKQSYLDNGLRVVTEHTNDNSATIGIFFQAGSRFEYLGQSGIAHFAEHMLFKGTTNRSKHELE